MTKNRYILGLTAFQASTKLKKKFFYDLTYYEKKPTTILNDLNYLKTIQKLVQGYFKKYKKL